MTGRWGGKHDLTFAEYHSVPSKWSAIGIAAQHAALRGTFDLGFSLEELGPPHPRAHESMWYRISDGIRACDESCKELAVRFIEDRFISSYSGFARARMARALKSAALSADQKARLSRHFLALLEAGDRTEEFPEYLRLWSRIAPEEDRKRAIGIVDKMKDAAPKFHALVVAALTSPTSERP
jgi:hypothetical protein